MSIHGTSTMSTRRLSPLLPPTPLMWCALDLRRKQAGQAQQGLPSYTMQTVRCKLRTCVPSTRAVKLTAVPLLSHHQEYFQGPSLKKALLQVLLALP